jgi:hypothetical protein
VPKQPPVIDLDAHRRESTYPDGIPLVFGGEEFVLPAQLPLEVFDPFLSEELGLAALIRDFFAESDDKDDVAQILDALVAHPGLPKQVIAAIMDAMALLFGAEDFARFQRSSARPGVGDYLFLARNLIAAYGVTLGEAFASPDSSESTGTTPSPTSPAGTPTSTSELSGSEQAALAAAGVVEPPWDPIPAPEPARVPDAHILPAPAPVPEAAAPVPTPTAF